MQELSPYEIKILEFMSNHDGCEYNDVTDSLGESVSNVLIELQREGYVYQSDDYTNWYLSQHGKAYLTKYNSIKDSLFKQKFTDRLWTILISVIAGIIVGLALSNLPF